MPAEVVSREKALGIDRHAQDRHLPPVVARPPESAIIGSLSGKTPETPRMQSDKLDRFVGHAPREQSPTGEAADKPVEFVGFAP